MSEKKYRFRKMYFLCANKKVIQPDTYSTMTYQYKDLADTVLKERKAREPSNAYWRNGEPLPQLTVEGFYLVHESFFEEVLKPWVKDEHSADDDKV